MTRGPSPVAGRSGRIARLVALAALLLASAVPPAVADDLPDSFARVAEGPLLPAASALHGDQLVWASPLPSGSVNLMRTNLSTQQTSILTSIVAQHGLRIPGIAFDGRWLVWLDDRFGNVDAFAMDTSSGDLKRLTATPYDEEYVAAAAGRAAWTLRGKLTLGDLGAGTQEVLPGSGSDTQPCLSDSHLAWSRVEDGSRDLMAFEFASGRTWTAVHEPTFSQGNPHCDGARVAWEGLQRYNPDTKTGSDQRVVRWMDLADGTPQNVTSIDVRNGQVVGFAAGRLAWIDVANGTQALRVRDAEGKVMDFDAAIKFLGISADALVVAREGALDQWTLYAQRWNAGPSSGSNWIPGLPAGLLAVAVAAAGRRLRA